MVLPCRDFGRISNVTDDSVAPVVGIVSLNIGSRVSPWAMSDIVPGWEQIGLCVRAHKRR